MSQMPRDSIGNPVPALRLAQDDEGESKAHTISVSDTSAKNTTAFTCKVASFYATVPVYLKFAESDDVTATSSDHYFPAGIYYDFAIGINSPKGVETDPDQQYTHVAALRAGSDNGSLYISEKE